MVDGLRESRMCRNKKLGESCSEQQALLASSARSLANTKSVFFSDRRIAAISVRATITSIICFAVWFNAPYLFLCKLAVPPLLWVVDHMKAMRLLSSHKDGLQLANPHTPTRPCQVVGQTTTMSAMLCLLNVLPPSKGFPSTSAKTRIICD